MDTRRRELPISGLRGTESAMAHATPITVRFNGASLQLVQRRACGFRSFHNYRVRVIAQCG